MPVSFFFSVHDASVSVVLASRRAKRDESEDEFDDAGSDEDIDDGASLV